MGTAVRLGSTKQFQFRAYAYFKGYREPHPVNWSVSGANGGTSISSSGLLTISANQSPGTITVKATSTLDPYSGDTVNIKVLEPWPTKRAKR
jgi:hypothetical protein